MDANTLFIDAQKYCWFNEVYVIVKPVNNYGKYRIAIVRNGKEKLGHEVYEGTMSFKKVEVKLPSGKIEKHKVAVPAVHTKIRELYIDLYQQSFNN